MKSTGKFGIIVLLIALVLIAIIDATSRKPIDWRKSFDQRDKIPYGLYVLHQELGNILGNDRKIESTKKSVYETLEEDSLHAKNTAFVFIGEYIDIMGATATEKLLQFAKEGGEVFISTNYYSANLLDTLNLSSAYLDVNKFSGFSLLGDINYSLVNNRKRIKYDKIEQTSIFDLIDSTNISIVGNAYAGKHAVPNFVEVSWGKGKLYLHHTPEMFTNYYMLQHQKYDYAASALKLIKAKNIIWCDNYYREGQPSTPLRMILSYEGLREAWYLLLFGLLLFLLFRSKREQRAVEVVTPEPNLSKEFAKTIGMLYYENGEPGNMVDKKIDYFLFDIRNHFQLDTLQLSDEKFLNNLSLKAGIPLAETEELINLITRYRNRKDLSTHDLKFINSKIEEFKTKSNMI
ncbi:DUF4350 domain-containing protein [Sphingobacterium spiritivorum]|uniref:DUF4350 domain-containing protein n=1 Tax=Sphingobacterium spiritivorum TaxID=258 RepID=UPI00368F4DBC